MKLGKLLILCLTFWSTAAISGSYPIPQSIRSSVNKPYNDIVTWTVIDIPEADAPAPAGFWFGSAKSIGTVFPVNQSETCSNTICSTKVIPGDTISSVAMRAYNKGPSVTQYPQFGGANGFCIAFGGIPQGNTSYASALLPTGCMKAPPSNVHCFIVTPEIYLNHGNISIKDVTKSKASASFSINCSQNNTIKLSLESKSTYVSLDGNAKANILINNKQPGEQHALSSGLSSLTITSQLEGITQGGVYSGTAVLIIESI